MRRGEAAPEAPLRGPQKQQSQREQQVELHLHSNRPGGVVAAASSQLVVLEHKIRKGLPASADIDIKCGPCIKTGTPAQMAQSIGALTST